MSNARISRTVSELNMPNQNHGKPIAQIIGIILLLWALVPSNPYSYYILLRWIVCGIFVYLTVEAHKQKKTGLTWTLGITAALYNPIFRTHLDRDIWSLVNIATIVLLIITIVKLRRTNLQRS